MGVRRSQEGAVEEQSMKWAAALGLVGFLSTGGIGMSLAEPGDPAVFGRLQGMLVQFDPAFEILPGTKTAVVGGPG